MEIDTEAVKILRTVSDREAFYFYEAIGKPTGESAKSLLDFLQKTESVKLDSLRFHLKRKDFQNWIKNTLGDSTLARRMARIPHSNRGDLKTRIQATIENRVKQLQELSPTLSINEDLTVTSPSATS